MVIEEIMAHIPAVEAPTTAQEVDEGVSDRIPSYVMDFVDSMLRVARHGD